MALITLLWLSLSPVIWLGSKLLTGFSLILILTFIWRAYKTVLVHKIAFLRQHCLKPVEARQAVLITGASSGLGLALAKHLYKIGYSVIATYYDTKEAGYEELKRLQSSSSSAPRKLLLHPLDVTNQEQVRQLYEKIERELVDHNLDLYALVNNAGLGSLQPFAWLQRRTISKLIETNITGALQMTREFLPLLAKSKKHGQGSRLVFVSSGLGLVPGATYATYGITKAAHRYFSRCMNLELKERYGIQSVAVLPHNFIKNTNICAQNVHNNQLAWEELKPIERELYATEHKEHMDLAKSLEKASRELARVAKASSDHSAASRRAPATSFVQRALASTIDYLNNLIASLQGTNLYATLEESGALECFEDALRLRDPPEEIFAGDFNFQLIIGSLLLSLPHSLVGLLSKSVAPSLYK